MIARLTAALRFPGLARRLQSVLKELDDLPQSRAVSKADEIAAQRNQRRQRGPDAWHYVPDSASH